MHTCSIARPYEHTSGMCGHVYVFTHPLLVLHVPCTLFIACAHVEEAGGPAMVQLRYRLESHHADESLRSPLTLPDGVAVCVRARVRTCASTHITFRPNPTTRAVVANLFTHKPARRERQYTTASRARTRTHKHHDHARRRQCGRRRRRHY